MVPPVELNFHTQSAISGRDRHADYSETSVINKLQINGIN